MKIRNLLTITAALIAGTIARPDLQRRGHLGPRRSPEGRSGTRRSADQDRG